LILQIRNLLLQHPHLLVLVSHLSEVLVSIDVELFLKYLEIPHDPLHLYDFVFEHLEHRLAVLQLGFILLFCVGGFLELQRDVFEVHLQLIYYFMSLLLRLLLLILSIYVIGE